LQNFTQKDVKIFLKVLGGATLFETPCKLETVLQITLFQRTSSKIFEFCHLWNAKRLSV